MMSRPGPTAPLLAVIVVITTGWGAFVLHDRQLISWFTDDTFYYLEVARHVAAGGGFTFDGIHPTNGFQPLWQFLLVALVWAAPGDFLPLRLLILLQSGLLAGATILFWKTLRGLPGSSATTSLLLIALPGASFLWLGMESALVLLLLVATWRAWLALETRQTPDPGACWRLGSCCALLFLARLEGSFALIAALILGAGRLGRSAGRARLLASLLLPFALAAGTYLLWNWYRFGLWLPVSGMIKTHWFVTLDLHRYLVGLVDIPWIGRYALERIYGTPMPPDGARLLCGGIALAAVALAWRRRTRLAPLLNATGTTFLVLCCGGIMAIDQVLVGPFLADWATVPVHLLTVVAVGLAMDRMVSLRRVALVAVVVLCLLRIPVQAGRADNWGSTFTGRLYGLAEWMSANVPSEDRIGSLFSGVLAYFGHRSVVSLDGLVNDADFYREVLIGGQWDSYLQSTHITWLTDVRCRDHPPLATLSTVAHGGFRSAPCYSPVYTLDDAPRGTGCALVLWRRAEACGPETPGSPP